MTLDPSDLLGITYLEESQDNGHVTFNELVNVIDSVLGAKVIDRDLTAPPGGESNGDLYIVGGPATGDWTGQDGNLALYYDGYIFITPKEGMVVYIDDEDVYEMYDGSAWGGIPLKAKNYTDGTRPIYGKTGRIIYNSTDGNLNIDTGTGWILPDGTGA